MAGFVTAGTPLVGFLNGRSLFGGRDQKIGTTASTDSPSSGASGFSRFFGGGGRQEPKTSTPTDKRANHALRDSFGAMTPIRDDAGRRSTLGRPSLAYLAHQDETDLPALKKRPGFFSRLLADPIHLTPQPSSREESDRIHTRHELPRPRPLVFSGSDSSSRNEDESWFSNNVSRVLLGLFILFLAVVLAYYARMKWESSDIDSSIMHFRLGRPALGM